MCHFSKSIKTERFNDLAKISSIVIFYCVCIQFGVCASSLGINSLETATKAFYDHDLLKFPFKISIFYSFGFNYLFIFLMTIEITLYNTDLFHKVLCFQF